MLYLFDRKEVLRVKLKRDDLLECIQVEGINETTTLSFSIRLDALYKMENIEIVGHEDVNNNGTYQLYKIIESKIIENRVDYQGILLPFYELTGYGYVADKKADNIKIEDAMEMVLAGSRWEVGIVKTEEKGAINFYRTTRLEAISKILETWEIELNYRVSIEGSKIVNRYVDIYKERGRETNKRFVEGHKALEIVKEITDVDLYTAILPRGKTLDSGSDKSDKRIEIGSVSWSTENKDPLNKPVGQIWLEDYEMTEKYGYSDNTPRFKIVEYNDIEDATELINAAYRDLKLNSSPKVQFRLKAMGAEGLEIGDKVGVIRRSVNIVYTTRVFRVTRDLIGGEVTEIEFGDNIDYSQSVKNKRLLNKINKAASISQISSIRAMLETNNVEISNNIETIEFIQGEVGKLKTELEEIKNKISDD
ncbi:phage tail spike protein [Miniphocaeibacter massiliensis]|uniref:phage tail spike protein n=1 Tax=Miniphocaeibacter massiliensis TaxID=2041841 RepID=UPI000C1C77AD|nr:phage tail spike protein [Miniphocaeibacter massiliensis]